ncbi:MAG: Solute-binding protein [Porticoccaceae bacterium UBA1117]|jgi:TRAP-type C4-dicarboxylate transport system substrate-binding protein|nr:MAG: Solute-binding protein [Porticoccaceae bacterium UBA1117]
MKKFTKSMVSVTLGFAMMASASWAQDLKMLTAWGSNHSGTVNMAYGYIELVEKMSSGATTITASGPEVVPAGKQLQPVSAGVFDIIYTHGLYHTGDTGIGAAIDAVSGDIESRRNVGVWDWVDQHYQETQGLKILSIPTATTGFRFFLKEPMDATARLDGMKIRALPSYNTIVGSLGATAVVVPFGELYSATEKGVIDGLVWPTVGAVGFKFHEVAPYLAEPAFGTVSYLIMMNLDKWNSLNSEVQNMLLKAGHQLEKDSIGVFNALLIEENAAMMAEGAKTTSIGYSLSEANALFAERAMEVAIEASGATGEAFRDFVASKGM